MKDMQNFQSVNIGDYAVLNFLAVDVPGLAVLVSALFFISEVTMNEKNCKIGRIEVWQRRGKPGWEGPRDRHKPVTKIVDVASHAPPTISQKRLGPCWCLDGLEGLY